MTRLDQTGVREAIMRFIHPVLACVGLVLIAGCGGSGTGGIAGKSSDLPPEEFLEAPLSFGDIDDTSMCFRTQQLVFHITGMQGGWKWTKLADATWDYTVPLVTPGGKQGSARLRLTGVNGKVRVLEYEEIVDGREHTRGAGPGITLYVKSFFATIKQSGAQFIAGCEDPTDKPKQYATGQ
jgi:hypothetical protein